jgi:NitT/TauT family transport system substrate-binding protein
MSQFSKQRRQLMIGGMAAVGSTAIGSTAIWAEGSPAQPEKFVAVMDWLPSWKQAAFHLAKVKGWYRDVGLDVQVDDGSGSATTIAQAFTGRCDVGLASLSTMAAARSKGTDVVAVAGIIRKNDLGMFVDRKLGISDPRQLAGKNARIIFASTGFQSLFPPFFKNLGIDVNQVNLTPMVTGSVEGAYLAGQGEAMITTVPYVSPIVDEQRPSDIFMFADYGLPFPAHGLVVGRDTLTRRPDALRKFLSATEKAWHQVWYGNAQEAINALMDQRPQAKLNAQLELKRVAAYKPFAGTKATEGKGDLWMPPEDWEAAIKLMREAEIVLADSKATDFYTNAFVRES